MTLLLSLIITLTVPSPSDAAYIAALACGESCGMPRAAQELIIANLLYDQAQHGTDWLATRWYAPLKPHDTALVYEVLDKLRQGERWPRCRLIGSARDAAYWRENGYVEGEPDYQWVVKDMQINAFGCQVVQVRFAPVGCEGERCPE